jgi:putative transposase
MPRPTHPYLPTAVRGIFFYLYLMVDLFSRKVVGFRVHEAESMELSPELLEASLRSEGVGGAGLVVHADNGGPMKGSTMLATMQRLGVVPSFSRPSVSDDNAYAEAFFRHLKYAPSYPRKPFATAEEARRWVERFVRWYNDEHRHSGIRFVTPSERHRGEDGAVLGARREVYERARRRRPERWSGSVRDWTPVAEVALVGGRAAGRSSKKRVKGTPERTRSSRPASDHQASTSSKAGTDGRGDVARPCSLANPVRGDA